MDIFLWTGFTFGILGSLHCLGMCGPIMLAVPHISSNKTSILFDGIIYNFGRSLTYAFMGLILGMLGVSLRLAGWQDYISIAMGVILILFVIIPKRYYSFLYTAPNSGRIISNIKKHFRNLIQTKSRFSIFFIGILNGFLPCGLVYVALAASIAATDLLTSSLYMFVFGIGTMPMLVAIYFSKNLISVDIRNKLNKLVPYAIVLVGVILILRGMNLGIPFISPILPETVIEKGSCCH